MSKFQSIYQPKYAEKNKEKITAFKYNYRRTDEYRKRNRDFIKNNKHIVTYRNVLNNVVKRLKLNKNNKRSIDLLGYSIQDFKIRIESQFKPGMTWENHGEWHIDHKKAIIKFEKNTDIRIINALSNLQPLWAKENLSKGVK